MNASRISWLSAVCSVAIISGACRKATSPANESAPATGSGGATAAARVGAGDEKFPEPRWPSSFKKPNSVDDLMQAARALVRNQSGLQGKGLGILTQGESVLIVASNDSDPMVLEAVKRALEERKVKPYIKYHLRDDRANEGTGRYPPSGPHQGPEHRARRHLPGICLDHRRSPTPASRKPGSSRRTPSSTPSSSRVDRRRAGPRSCRAAAAAQGRGRRGCGYRRPASWNRRLPRP